MIPRRQSDMIRISNIHRASWSAQCLLIAHRNRNIDDERMDVDGAIFTRPNRQTESSAVVIMPSSRKRQYSSDNRQQQERADGGDRSLLDRSRVSLSPESPSLDEEETTKKPASPVSAQTRGKWLLRSTPKISPSRPRSRPVLSTATK
jgi:hypothetical protein